MFGDAEHSASQHRVGFGRAIGRQYGRLVLADRIENIGQKIENTDIDLRLFTAMVVAQEDTQLVDDPRDRPLVVAVRTIKGLAGMAVDETQAAQRQRRAGNCTRY
jgi:hypothetical protein